MPPVEVDLRTEGSSVTIGGVIYEDSENVNSGTGGYNTFLALFDQGGSPQSGGNDGEEDGINSEGTDPGNPEVNDAKTHAFTLGSLAVVSRVEGDFYQFRVDINENAGGVHEQISLDQFKIYSAASGTIGNLADLVSAGALEYDMDALGDVSILLIQDSSGGGTDDYSVFIPKSVFDGLPPETYIYTYIQMGALGGDYKADSGFEEWRALTVGDVPSIEVDKTFTSVTDGDDAGETGLADGAGDIINYAITVENVGTVPLTGITVKDQVEGYAETDATYVSGDSNLNNILDTGEIWTFSVAYVLTQADLDGKGGGDGYLNNVATGDSNESDEDSDTAIVELVYDPKMNVTKDVASIEDFGEDWGDDNALDSVGDKVNYTITIQNTGNISLTNVQVTDKVEAYGATNATLVSGDAGVIGVLDVGETWVYSASYTITQADLDGKGGGDGFLDNLATGSTTETPNDTDTESVPLAYLPSLDVTKEVTSIDDTDDWGGTGQLDSVGDKVNYLVSIANTGNISLTDVSVSDLFEGNPAALTVVDDGNGDNVLDVGETWTYSYSYTITQDDLDGKGGGDGLLTNVATGDSDETDPDDSTVNTPLVYLPSVDIEKYVSVDGGLTWQDADTPFGPIAEDVATVGFKFVVTNTGNVTLTGVSVTDTDFDLNGILPDGAWSVGTLAVGSAAVELIIDVPWQLGQHANVGTVTTAIPGVTDSDAAHYFGVEGPGVRTPGFWQSKFGSQFWDDNPGNEEKAGKWGFADGELTYMVDSGDADNIKDTTKGLLIGDWDGDGVESIGENTLFIDLKAAQLLINASEKEQGDARYQIGRDIVATWLNHLAGNPVGPDDGPGGAYSARELVDDAISWLQTYGDPLNNGLGYIGGSKPKIDFDGLSAVKLNVGGGNTLHQYLDEYNNFGTVNGTVYALDSDNPIFN